MEQGPDPVPLKTGDEIEDFGTGEEGQQNERAFGLARKRGIWRLPRRGQANKSARGMPWHQEPKKVVTSCDKPGGGAHIL